jgi:manganese oxidase
MAPKIVLLSIAGLPLAAAVSGPVTGSPSRPVVQSNSNTSRAGSLKNGVLTVTLEAKQALWQLNAPKRPPMTIEAFAEPGKAPLIPGPLVRAARGTTIRFSLHNSLATPLTFFVPVAVRGGPDNMKAMDSVVVAPGAVGELSTAATVPGNYIYRATTPAPIAIRRGLAGLLTGAMVVDTVNAPAKPNDRVLVLLETPDSEFIANFSPTRPPALDTLGRLLYTINGRSWPNTERVHATVGDSLHWRVINASAAPHPMHLHGFYYRVDSFTGPLVGAEGQGPPGRKVVTELMWPFSSMSMTWSPDRPGNWLFHCHFAIHLEPDSLSAEPDDPHHRGMVGLVMGILVAPRTTERAVAARQAGAPASMTRHLRLVAIEDTVPGDDTFPGAVPSMRFVLEENGRRTEAPLGHSPELDLVRGQPVSITIVNHIDEPTSVHWHGIEVEDSYVDGVAGFSGAGNHLAPEIAPGDSFTAHFTPPRSGTFMYHAHMDEVRQDRAGMMGPLIVREPGVAPSPDEHVFFLNGSRRGHVHPLEINGSVASDTIVLRAGRPARLRLLSLAWSNPTPMLALTAPPDNASADQRDTVVVRWTPLAKDGFDLPMSEQTPRPARQVVSMGETYDFAFTPNRPGLFKLEARTNPPPGVQVRPQLLAQVVIRAQ